MVTGEYSIPIWYTHCRDAEKLSESYPDVCAKHRYRWFKREKVTRALDFEWAVFLDGGVLGANKFKNLVLLRRTWESLRARVPEKANYRRLREAKGLKVRQ